MARTVPTVSKDRLALGCFKTPHVFALALWNTQQTHPMGSFLYRIRRTAATASFLFRGAFWPTVFTSSAKVLNCFCCKWHSVTWNQAAASNAWSFDWNVWIESETDSFHFFHPPWNFRVSGIPKRVCCSRASFNTAWKGSTALKAWGPRRKTVSFICRKMKGMFQYIYIVTILSTQYPPYLKTSIYLFSRNRSSSFGVALRLESTATSTIPMFPMIMPFPHPRCHPCWICGSTTSTPAAAAKSFQQKVASNSSKPVWLPEDFERNIPETEIEIVNTIAWFRQNSPDGKGTLWLPFFLML